MKRELAFGFSAIALVMAASAGRAQAAEKCDPVGKAQFVCLTEGAEDIAHVPKSDWVIVSGVLRAVNTKDHAEVDLYPSADKFDKKTYAGCPGPIGGAEAAEKKIRAGGLNVEEGANGIHKLRFLHGGERRAVEVFELNATGKTPTLAWVGCIPYPQDAGFNSMGVLPNNGVVATNFLPASMGGFRGDKGANSRARLSAGENVSSLFEWTPAGGWAKIPGSEGSGLNGIEASKDGKAIYVSEWAVNQVVKFTREPGKPAVKEVIARLNFHPDNLRWQPDGTLVVAGQTGTVEDVLNTCLSKNDCSKNSSSAAIIDPVKKTAREVVTANPDSAAMHIATAGTIVGKEIWLANIGGGMRIGRFQLP